MKDVAEFHRLRLTEASIRLSRPPRMMISLSRYSKRVFKREPRFGEAPQGMYSTSKTVQKLILKA